MIKITLIKEGSDKQETTISYVAEDRKQEVLQRQSYLSVLM